MSHKEDEGECASDRRKERNLHSFTTEQMNGHTFFTNLILCEDSFKILKRN